MFVHYDKSENMRPIKIWQTDLEAVGEKCIEQAEHLAKLPFTYKWAALIPDTHAGKRRNAYRRSYRLRKCRYS